MKKQLVLGLVLLTGMSTSVKAGWVPNYTPTAQEQRENTIMHFVHNQTSNFLDKIIVKNKEKTKANAWQYIYYYGTGNKFPAKWYAQIQEGLDHNARRMQLLNAVRTFYNNNYGKNVTLTEVVSAAQKVKKLLK